MPYLLRQIKKSRWYPPNQLHWLGKNEIQAEPLGDLVTNNNNLSVWLIEDNKSNLERIISALAANREHLANFDYALFKYDFLQIINIQHTNSSGSSPDDWVNNNWHLELIELSAQKILKLAEIILEDGELKRCTEQQIKKLINSSINNNYLNIDKINEKIKSKVSN